jgi:hypothetical protein
MRFEENPNFEKEIGEQVRQVVVEAANEVARTHSGRPESEISGALIAAAGRRGLPDFKPPDTIVRAISEGKPPEFR